MCTSIATIPMGAVRVRDNKKVKERFFSSGVEVNRKKSKGGLMVMFR